MSSVTPFEHTLIGMKHPIVAFPLPSYMHRVTNVTKLPCTTGALGGSVEVILMQPMVGIKNALQEGRPVPANPLHLYRGLAVSTGASLVI